MAADFRKAKREAELLLQKYSITRPPVDPEWLAEQEGLKVLYANFNDPYKNQYSGVYDKNHKTASGLGAIVINNDISVERANWTIAHELGHFILHGDWISSQENSVIYRSNDWTGANKPYQEQEADAFAANLLMPEEFVVRYERAFKSDSILAGLFHVSEPAMRFRLLNLRKRGLLVG